MSRNGDGGSTAGRSSGTVRSPLKYRIETVTVLETAIDDMTPEDLGYLVGLLLGKGALDVYLMPVYMKKNRPGVMLKVICRPSDTDLLAEFILGNTSTLGIRIRDEKRIALDKDYYRVDVEIGGRKYNIGVKYAPFSDNFKPEYEDLVVISRETGIPLFKIRKIVEERIRSKFFAEKK